MPNPDPSTDTNAKAIAAFVGPLVAAIGASILVNRDSMIILARQLSDDYGLIFVSGGLLLLAGIAIVRVNNGLTGDWRSVITVMGWVAIVSGLVRMLFFRQLASMAPSIAQYPLMLTATSVLMLALGIFLMLKAFR